ncbi:MAG: pyrroline-5-carboxylate reductase dimerization domain-containing protein, partial [Planctomycetota bacterium]
FRFVEALAEAGARAGLPEDLARSFARETVIGAARLLEESPESPEALRRRVTSPGGTTEAALAKFDERRLMEIVAEAVDAARKRSQELGAG